ncbi:MAG TPA: 50S ribosomal protein L18 [Candidatus Nanoarchaeia archaeon]|nr:50S ribosomal protein L18 [Candidatus Nanoarchaeia archaeon]
MARKLKKLPLKRKRLGKTDYKKRLALISGNKPRLVVRRFSKNIIAQIVEFHPDGDKVVVSAHTNELKKKFGMTMPKKNITSAYLIGLLVGKKASQKKIKNAVLDIGLQRPVKGSLLFAVVKGAVDAGIDVPHSKEILPDEKRIKGEHLKKSEYETMRKKIIGA